MAKFEVTFSQYLNLVVNELSNRLSEKCKITIVKNEYGFGGLRSVTKEYPEFDLLKIELENWRYTLDTQIIESAYRSESSIDKFVNELVCRIKEEFVKLIMR